LLFPQARVIHCRRHPLDTCLSCFAQPLPAATHPYVLDLQRLATVFVQYERLMAHWHTVLRIPILDVQYEALVGDQERVSREIVEFCGLPWDDRCLRFHRNKRVVQTSSYDQVTRPIYGSSVGRYRHFESQLAPLREALVAGGVGVE
ncbi:MAG: sulfotransferase, partial [Planctomycetes bacterium]|nr:sulfotransferase [Planctomycetota bacterium]